MTRTTPIALLLALALAALGCGGGADDHAADDHGHGHGEGEDHAWAVTAWGEQFELFPETEGLIAGRPSPSHVHVTVLEGFAPLTEGEVAIILRRPAGGEERFTSREVVRPGIFNVTVTPSEPGEHELLFEVTGAGRSETIPAGLVEVGPPGGHPGGLTADPPSTPVIAGEAGEPVPFLKEQQWRTAFATAPVTHGSLRASVSGPARVVPPAGAEVVLTAPVAGAVTGTPWPHVGAAVQEGATVLRLAPSVAPDASLAQLRARVQTLEHELGPARARLGRLEQLLEVEATSRREVEEARALAASLETRLEAARSDLAAAGAARGGGGGELPLRAPFAARVAEVAVRPGQTVAAGAVLVRLVRPRPVWVEVALPPAAAARLGASPAGLELRVGGGGEPVWVPAARLRLVAVAPELDPATGHQTVILEVDRTVGELPLGAAAEASVHLAEELEGIVVPSSALVDDVGQAVAYTQLDGESFARREVEVLAREGDRVLVRGLLPGERLVTVGAAAIRRSELLSGGDVAGHVH